MQPSIVHLFFISAIFLSIAILQLRSLVLGINARSVVSLEPESHPVNAESSKLSWSYRRVLTLKPVKRRAIGTGLDLLSSASNSIQVPSPEVFVSLPATSTSSAIGTEQAAPSTAPAQSISSLPSTGASASPQPVLNNPPSPSSLHPSSFDPDTTGLVSPILSDVTSILQASEAPITSIITKDGATYSYSATFVSSQTSVTTITTSEETNAAGAVFGVISFPDKGGRGWKFPCLASCEGGFSLPGPPPGFGALGALGGGGGGGSSGGGGGGEGGSSSGGGGGSNGGGGASNGSDSGNDDNKSDDEEKDEDEIKSQSQSKSTKSETSSTSPSSSQCSTQTASSCVQTCPPASQGSISTCFETCITSTGCSYSDTATTITQTCSSLPCQTLVVTTIGGSMTSETNCPDCAPTSTEVVTDLVESGWASTGSSYSYVTLLTITIVTDDGFVHPDFMVDTALEYNQMSSMDKEISARHTRTPSTLLTSVVVTSSISSSAQSIASSSQVPIASTPSSTKLSAAASSILSSSSPDVSSSSSSAQAQVPSSLPSSSSIVSSPSTTSTSRLQPTPEEPIPTPAPIADLPVLERLPITATRGECNPSGCVGVNRLSALEHVKKFCSTKITINSKTAIASSTASLTGVVIVPTAQADQLKEAELYLAIELDSKDDRCSGVEYMNIPKMSKASANGRDHIPSIEGPNKLCVDMMQTALDNCNTDTTSAKQGGKQIANCISWSVLATNPKNKKCE